MGVDLMRSERLPAEAGWQVGPAGAALNRTDGIERVWLDGRVQHPECWIWALHELEHLVFWRDDLSLDNHAEQLMMPWGVAVMRAGGLPTCAYLGSDYTSATHLPETWIRGRWLSEVGDWKQPQRSGWYRRARAANLAAGTITAAGLPTWRRPDWSAIRIEEHYDT